MITIIKERKKVIRQSSGHILVEIRCLSTDEKPTTCYNETIENGSKLIEIDTGKMYLFDLENEQWREV